MSQDEKRERDVKAELLTRAGLDILNRLRAALPCSQNTLRRAGDRDLGSVLSKHCSVSVLSFTVFQLSLPKWVDQLSRAWVGLSCSIPEPVAVRCSSVGMQVLQQCGLDCI